MLLYTLRFGLGRFPISQNFPFTRSIASGTRASTKIFLKQVYELQRYSFPVPTKITVPCAYNFAAKLYRNNYSMEKKKLSLCLKRQQVVTIETKSKLSEFQQTLFYWPKFLYDVTGNWQCNIHLVCLLSHWDWIFFRLSFRNCLSCVVTERIFLLFDLKCIGWSTFYPPNNDLSTG